MTEVRTRFAPSPTGFLHVGGLRTAAYGWLLAKHYGGTFILRLEDTDQERLVPGAIRGIFEELAWCGISIDEGPSHDDLRQVGEYWDGAPKLSGGYGPYIQSLRLSRYSEVAEQLVEQGFAYRCDCTPEMLEKERNEQMARKELPGYSGYCRTRNVSEDAKHVIRFKINPKRALTYTDAVKGKVAWETMPLKDTVILKSDKFPTYNFAVVVDDHDMKITHVMRGEEFISTTPIHLLLYEALGWHPPVFASLPVILGPSGKKLSKREGSVFSSVFRENGYLPEALTNFAILIGWSPGEGEEQEIFTREELIKRFTLEGINPASGKFDYDKLLWMNGMYIRKLTPDEFIERAKPFIEKAGLTFDEAKFKKLAAHVQERTKLMTDVAPMVDFLFVNQVKRDVTQMFKKGIDKEKAIAILQAMRPVLEGMSNFEALEIENVLRPLAETFGLKLGVMLGVLRIAMTGKDVTPPLFESLAALGKATTLKRIDETLDELQRG